MEPGLVDTSQNHGYKDKTGHETLWTHGLFWPVRTGYWKMCGVYLVVVWPDVWHDMIRPFVQRNPMFNDQLRGRQDCLPIHSSIVGCISTHVFSTSRLLTPSPSCWSGFEDKAPVPAPEPPSGAPGKSSWCVWSLLRDAPPSPIGQEMGCVNDQLVLSHYTKIQPSILLCWWYRPTYTNPSWSGPSAKSPEFDSLHPCGYS
jgi:hypothetical protein